jgi:hypothetical protein
MTFPGASATVPSPLSVPRLLRESLPIAVVLLFWTILSWPLPTPGAVAGPMRTAGVAMAALYVVVRGIALADGTTPPALEDAATLVRENARVFVAAAAWFLAAGLVDAGGGLWDALDFPGLFTSPVDTLASAFVLTGLGTVALYAVTVGVAAVRDDNAGSRPAATSDDD